MFSSTLVEVCLQMRSINLQAKLELNGELSDIQVADKLSHKNRKSALIPNVLD
jgi:hypothetical protein